jgi:hypothetical protein
LIAICSLTCTGGKTCSESDEEITFRGRGEEVSQGPRTGWISFLLRMHFFS